MKTFSAEDYCLRRLVGGGGTRRRGTVAEFYAAYGALQHVAAAVRDRSLRPGTELISRIATTLLDRRFTQQRQAYFFYQAAADALRIITLSAGRSGMAEQALHALRRALSDGAPAAQRAVMDTVGRLPTAVAGTAPGLAAPREIPGIRWQSLIRRQDLDVKGAPRLCGRSIVATVGGPYRRRLFVLKLARPRDCAATLVREAAWMEHLGRSRLGLGARFEIPTVLRVDGVPIFRVSGLPCRPERVPPRPFAVGFVAAPDYFAYPNVPPAPSEESRQKFKTVMLQNARLLGGLAATGIIHAAPIPLFHNRVQADRRDDHGRYDWFRGGRLDRWLASCRYPNFGPTGLRDFEHFIALKDADRRLFRYIGTHLLSLLLVSASHFRNRAPEIVGLDRAGQPVDARHLFDPLLFKEILFGIFAEYYEGVTGRRFEEALPFDLDDLVARMIDEMGVDRHMHEILRSADQDVMSAAAFETLLRRWGYSMEEIRSMPRGVADVTGLSGPHLGEFNGAISLPEMTAAVGTMAAVCVLARFRNRRRPADQPTTS